MEFTVCTEPTCPLLPDSVSHIYKPSKHGGMQQVEVPEEFLPYEFQWEVM